MNTLSTTLPVPHLPNLELTVHLSRLAALEPMTISRQGVSERLPAGYCPVMHCSTQFMRAARTSPGLETLAMSATLEGSGSCLGIFMTRSSLEIVAAVVDLGQFAELGGIDQAIRQGRMPLLLSTADGLQQRIVMPAVNGALRDVLVSGRRARAMTRAEFVEQSASAIRGLVEPGAAPMHDLGFRELQTLSMSICLLDHIDTGGADTFASGAVH